MNTLQPDTEAPETPQWFLDRGRDIGLIPWELDLNGQPTQDPMTLERIKVWLCSKPMRMRLVEFAEIWAAQDNPTRVDIEEVAHIIPFERRHRNRRIGYTVLIALEPELIEHPVLAEGFDENPLALNATQHELRPIVRNWTHNIDQIETLLQSTYRDAIQWHDNQGIIAGYTDQLSDSYEMIAAMHLLGKSVGKLESPGAFLELGVEMIASTLNARWACVLLDNPKDPTIGRCFQDGDTFLSDTQISDTLASIASTDPITTCDGATVYATHGAFDPFGPQLIVHELKGHKDTHGRVLVCGKHAEDQCVSSHDTKCLNSLAGIIISFLENTSLYEQQRETFLGTVKALSRAIDAKDPYTQGHSERVAMLGEQLALALGHPPEYATRVRLCGILHDVGKIGVPERILRKNARLTDDEFEAIKKHPTIGAEMLEGLSALSDIIPGVLHHHERWDGRGYPSNLSGDEIPEIGRILAIADTFDAMSSNRAYRSARPRQEVLEEIRRCSGSQFDPSMTDAFVSLDFTKYDDAVREHKSQAAYNEAA